MPNKLKLLAYADSPAQQTGTGFGTVSRYVLRALNAMFDIDVLAINYNGEFVDKTQVPYQLVPAKLLNPQDPYGTQMFVNSLLTGKYDFVWVMNDTFVVDKVGREIPKVFDQLRQANKKVPTIVYYFPVDCHVLPSATGMLEAADHVVAYCEFGKAEALKTLPNLANKISIINHGIDKSSFYTINAVERKMARQQLFKVTDDETFMWLNVNRNSPRKDIAKTILAFSEFRKQVPNSKMYLHTAIKDTTIDLSVCLHDLGLSIKTDVMFPANYAAHKPFPVEVLNAFYNSADAFITTALGGGFEITSFCEATPVGLPVVAPNNTCFTEQYTDKRGYLYPCKELTYIDNSSYRKMGRLDDIVETMMQCYQDVKSGEALKRTQLAKAYVENITWDKIGNQWLELFKSLQNRPKIEQSKFSGVTL